MEFFKEISTDYGNIQYGTAGKPSVSGLENDFPSYPKTPEVWKLYIEKWLSKEWIGNSKDLVVLNQVHGNSIHQVSTDSLREEAKSNFIWEGDGLYTDLPNQLLVVRTADCVPVYLFSTKRPFVAIIHSGWKGTNLGITERMMERAIEIGYAQDELYMEIGPYIQGSDYEVGIDVAKFFSGFGEEVCCSKGNEKFLLDVGLAIEKRVKERFPRLGGIQNSHTNVYKSPLYFSHRAKEEGRNLNFILWES